MPCPFTGPKMFCAGPNFLSQPKNLTAFSASTKTFVLVQKTTLLNANHLFIWHKKFAQNILGPGKGQGRRRAEIFSSCTKNGVTALVCANGVMRKFMCQTVDA